MARSTFYYNVKHIGCSDGYDAVRKRIQTIFDTHKGRYGYRRITAALHNEGVEINHKTVRKLMQQMGLKANRRKRHYHSYRGEVGRIAPNIIQRNFIANHSNQKWTTDITQVNIRDQKLYLSPIMDMYNGEIISYSVSRRPSLQLVTSMLDKAFKKVKNTEGMIMHSDQGWHYQHVKYQQILKSHGIIQSMSRKGNCLDNSIMENIAVH